MRTVAIMLIILLVGCGGGDAPFMEDPLQKDQWYLHESKYNSNINLPRIFPYKGKGVTIAIVDDGVDIYHEDLFENISFNNHSYLSSDFDFSDADHGTAVAGIIAAIEGNGIGGRGIAPESTIVSFNALRAPSTSNLADALVRNLDSVDISNNSWGDFNSWGEPFHLRLEIEKSLIRGTKLGRSGLGIVYIFSAGNGELIDLNGIPYDNVNYSGLVNNRYTLPICAIDKTGRKTSYSEIGATLLICAPSKGLMDGLGIVTTDQSGLRGYNNNSSIDDYENKSFTKYFGGTSAAAPMVTGAVALILEANPHLSWRDIRQILAQSAFKNDALDIDWKKNGAGYWINHNYGFGSLDIEAAVSLARNWSPLPKEKTITAMQQVSTNIPDDDDYGVSSSIHVTEIIKVEFIDIFFNAPDHTRVGDLEIILTSPSGTESRLAELHNQTLGVFRYNNWRFGSLRHLGENSNGEWKLVVKDKRSGDVGVFKDWKIEISGHD